MSNVNRLLASAPVLPGARLAVGMPDAALTQAAQVPVSENLIDQSRLWTAPGSGAEAIAYIEFHVPAGLTLSGRSDSDASSSLTFSDGSASAAYDDSRLLLTVRVHDGKVDVRADAQAIWLPGRPPGEMISGTVMSAEVSVDRSGTLPTVDRTLTGAPARILVSAINALPVAAPGAYNCPADMGWIDTLTLRTSTGLYSVRANVTGCGDVQVETATPQPALSGGRGIDEQLVTVLGLPASYRG